MERRHHNRIPVELNAVLIGEKTVPKGCKVSNLSQQGILLECVPDGRVSTFQKGNIVNVHLLFQQSGGCKYLTKTADVKHADEYRVGVEFHQPDSNLIEFIKPCRSDSKHTLDTPSAGISASGTEGPDMQNAMNVDFIDEASDTTTVTETKEPDMATGKDRMVFFTGLAFIAIAAGLALGAWLYTSHINTRIGALETVTKKHTSELVEMQEWASPASMLEGKFAFLNAQMKALTNSFEKLENRLTKGSSTTPVGSATPPVRRTKSPVKIVAQTETPAARASTGETTTAPVPAKSVKKPAASVAKTAEKRGKKTTATKKAAATAGAAAGAWVINLTSSPDKADADRFAARARTKDIPAKLVKAEVNGRDYWRVQLTGFASQNAARDYSGAVREKLGLKDVWIFRQ